MRKNMKEGIHPTYYPEATVTCACGNTWVTGSTEKVIRTDVCSACHPFFTGEQRIVDTAGQVDRFMRRLQAAEARSAQVRVQQAAEDAGRKAAAQARARGESSDKVEQAATKAAEEAIAAVEEELQAEEAIAAVEEILQAEEEA
ncbi:MAG: 50S ribosomal protein L31 [Chloroflexota bacterium]|nr:50S ribosomal protein L31 [Chloroflexota bacterium]